MSPSLTSLISDVYSLTKRPDLVSETLTAVRAATLKAHNSDYFYKDLFETGVQCDQALAQQSFDYKLLIPRWRSLKYIRPYDISTDPGTVQKYLEVVTPDNVVDSYAISKEDVCYVAGRVIQIRTSKPWQYYLVGCYVYPDVTTDNYDSWIATDHPFAIIFEAAATIFKTIGFDEQFSSYQSLVSLELAELKMSNIVATGY